MEMYNRIRDFRKNDLHMSQEEFGKQIGVSRSVIANIELNLLARPEQKDPLIKLICKEFGINELWLKTGEGNKYSDEYDDEYTKAVVNIDKGDPKAREAILCYWRLSDEDKKLFWEFMDRFIKK